MCQRRVRENTFTELERADPELRYGHVRFKRLRDSEEPRAISGTMDYTLPVQNPFSPNDTVKFEIRILDRALNESNVIQTDPIFTNPSLKQ